MAKDKTLMAGTAWWAADLNLMERMFSMWEIIGTPEVSIDPAAVSAAAPTSKAYWEDAAADYGLKPYSVENGVLTVPIKGVLTNTVGFTVPGLVVGYDYVKAAVLRGSRDPDVETILLDMDTPGGFTAGMFEAAAAVREVASEKNVVAAANMMATSAGYMIMSAATEVVLTESSAVGSIGAFVQHVDITEALNRAGIKVTYFSAGKNKIRGVPEVPLSDEDKAEIQARVDEVRAKFVARVAEYRNLGESWRDEITADVFEGEKAIEQGLADKVVPDVWGYVTGGTNMTKKTGGLAADNTNPEDIVAKAPEASAPEAEAPDLDKIRAEERERVLAVLDDDRAKAFFDTTKALLAKGLDAEAIFAVLDTLPEPQAATPAPAPETSAATPFEEAMAAEGKTGEAVGMAAKTNEEDDRPEDKASQLVATYKMAIGAA